MPAKKRKLQPNNQQPTLFRFMKQCSPDKVAPAKKPRKKVVEEPELVTDDNYVFFYGRNFPFSQFHACKFTVDGTEYNCMEQYMHHQKAVVFKDKTRASLIMASNDPLNIKKLGRQVENFDKVVWGKKSVEVVKKGNLEKFSQNPELKAKLFATHPKTLVEASPRDRLWGIGLGAKNPKARDPSKWRGRNLLGHTLTDVRNELMEREKS